MAIEQEPISLNFENDEEAMQLLSLMKKGKLTSAKYADLLNLFVGNGWSLRDLITKCSHFNVRRKDENGRTCLHYAAEINDVDVVMFLITEFDLRPKETDFYGNTLLHCAADEGSLDVMRYLIDKHGCDPMAVNKKGKAVIHCAIKHINVVKYLIDICDCNLIKTLDCNHASLLHHAAWKGAVDVMKYLISECNCSPMSVCKDGKTVLHDAVTFNNAEVVEYLLSTGLCDPLAQDKHRKTPSQIAHERSRDLIPLFEKFGQVQLSYPVESYVNVFLLGYPGAGKSTLFHAITSTATGFHYFGSIRYGEKVKSCTAGIIPKKLQHIKLGNIILHDFAGHSEYYSSHSAVIENLMQGSDGVYLVVVNILENEAAKQLYQWLTVVNNEAQKSPNECVIIIVISHMDKKNDLVERRKREIQQIIRSKRYHGIVFIDCRRLGGSGFDSLFNKLSSACKSIRTRVKKLSLYCHMMYGLLEESNENILTFPDFMSAATCNDKFVLPNEKAQLLDILFSLHSTGLISVCKSGEKLWVIVNRRLLLFEVNGVLFAPQTFPEYSNIASNTGIVSVSSLTKYFPDHNTDMLICFLKDMKLCQELTSLLMTNLSHQTDDEMNEDSLLFFPCLLRNERPDEVGKQVYQFGWCLQCTKKHEFFPPRYFHVLSLYLAYKMTAPHDEGLSRHCMFWKNGLSWFNTYGVSTLVEIVDENQCALVLMCCETDDYIDNMVHLRRDVIKEVMRVYNEFCPNIEAKEYLIDSNDLAYPVKKPKERTLYSVGAVLSTIMKGGTHLVSDNGYINLKLVLNGESLLDISKLSILGGRGIKVRSNYRYQFFVIGYNR